MNNYVHNDNEGNVAVREYSKLFQMSNYGF